MLNIQSPPTKPLNTRVDHHVRIIDGALYEADNSSSGIILQGLIDPSTLRFLKADPGYQRDLREREEIYTALKDGKVLPNIEIGVRGQDFVSDGADYIIRSQAYIIDGWQRIGNAIRFMDDHPSTPVRMFGSVHFDTTFEWEEQRFTDLNKNTKRISPNLHLRNLRNKSNGVLSLYGLSHADKAFPLHGMVSWNQNMHRGELITATILARVIRDLHGHHTSLVGSSPDQLAYSLDMAAQAISLNMLRRNAQSFFSIVNDCWPFAAIEYRRSATQVKGTFLRVVAKMFSLHLNFWNEADTALMVSMDDKRKLAKFPINDPQIINLAGAGGSAQYILYEMLISHMNSGRRTQRLEQRAPVSTKRR